MHTKHSLARRVIAGGAVLAALSMGPMAVVGQAGAASTPAAAAPTKTKTAPAVCRGGKTRFKPGHQGKGFEKQVAKLEAREAKAKAAGHTKRAAHLAKMVAHYEAVASHLSKHHSKVESRISAFVAKVCSASH